MTVAELSDDITYVKVKLYFDDMWHLIQLEIQIKCT